MPRPNTILRRDLTRHRSAGNNLAFVKETIYTEAVTGSTAVLTPANTAGNLLVLNIGNHGATLQTVSSVADTGGNTWSKSTNLTVSALDTEQWMSKTTAISGTLTVTFTSVCTSLVSCQEWSGANATPLDQVKSASTGTATVATGSSPSTTTANQVVIAFVAAYGTQTFSAQSAGFTVLSTLSSPVAGLLGSLQSAYKIVSTTGAQSYQSTISSAGTAIAMLGTYKSS